MNKEQVLKMSLNTLIVLAGLVVTCIGCYLLYKKFHLGAWTIAK